MTKRKILTSIGCVVLCVACAFMTIGFAACGDDAGSTETQGKEITGVTFEDASYTYDGTEKEITVSGTIPDGVSVTYKNNKATEVGTYNATATLSGDGYKPLTLTATLSITLMKIVGVTFEDITYTYDGTEKEITVEGTIPTGVSVVYENNKATEIGAYEATATLSGENYETLVLTATLTIKGMDITDVKFEDKMYIYDGTEKEITVTGTIPSGVTVIYENNKGTEIGEYNATATLSGTNYETLVLTATLRIVGEGNFAEELMDLVLEYPDPWSYLPSGLQEANLGYAENEIQTFETWTNVSAMNKKFVGLQLNVLYTIMDYATTTLGYLDSITSIAATVASLYQTFINSNPNNYVDFEMNILGFKVFIELTNDDYSVLIGNSTISMELVYDLDTEMRSGRIQLTDGIAMKYEYDEDYLKIAMTLTIANVGAYYELELSKENGVTSGYAFERYGATSIGLDSAAVIRCESDYTYVYSAQRESEDLIVNGYEEVYNSQTGEYVGGEIEETLGANYDTYWFNLYDVTGMNTVMVTEDSETSETLIYINNVEDVINPTSYGYKLGGNVLKIYSRRYDIELKTVYYYIKTTDGGETTYTKTKYSIPMIFVQKEKVDDFSTDMLSDNAKFFTGVTPALPTLPQTLLGNTYDSMKAAYASVKDTVTTETITGFIGEKNTLFDKDISDTYEEGDTNDGE